MEPVQGGPAGPHHPHYTAHPGQRGQIPVGMMHYNSMPVQVGLSRTTSPPLHPGQLQQHRHHHHHHHHLHHHHRPQPQTQPQTMHHHMVSPIPLPQPSQERASKLTKEEQRMAGLPTSDKPSCSHNRWMLILKRKRFYIMECMTCQSLWKTKLKSTQKCDAFFAGHCPLDDKCPHPHVYSQSRIKRDAAQADEERGGLASPPSEGSADSQELQVNPPREGIISLVDPVDEPPSPHKRRVKDPENLGADGGEELALFTPVNDDVPEPSLVETSQSDARPPLVPLHNILQNSGVQSISLSSPFPKMKRYGLFLSPSFNENFNIARCLTAMSTHTTSSCNVPANPTDAALFLTAELESDRRFLCVVEWWCGVKDLIIEMLQKGFPAKIDTRTPEWLENWISRDELTMELPKLSKPPDTTRSGTFTGFHLHRQWRAMDTEQSACMTEMSGITEPPALEDEDSDYLANACLTVDPSKLFAFHTDSDGKRVVESQGSCGQYHRASMVDMEAVLQSIDKAEADYLQQRPHKFISVQCINLAELENADDATKFQASNEVTCLPAVVGHPNILRYIGSFAKLQSAPKELWLVTESCPPLESIDAQGPSKPPLTLGGFLYPKERIGGRYVLDDTGIQKVARDMLSALAHLERCGWIHMDVHLDNFVFDEFTNNLKLTGFRAALSCPSGEVYRPIPGCGVIQFMAPECFPSARNPHCSHKSDVYSVGMCCLFVAGVPVERPQADINTYTPPPFSDTSFGHQNVNLRQCLSPKLFDFIKLCLTDDPSKRGSAAELLRHPFLRQS